MAPEHKGDRSNRIPINFLDADSEDSLDAGLNEAAPAVSTDDKELMNNMAFENDGSAAEPEALELDDELEQPSRPAKGSTGDLTLNQGGPEVAELVATRAELKRLEGEVKELKDSLARRQADFENYRKRMERERAD